MMTRFPTRWYLSMVVAATVLAVALTGCPPGQSGKSNPDKANDANDTSNANRTNRNANGAPVPPPAVEVKPEGTVSGQLRQVDLVRVEVPVRARGSNRDAVERFARTLAAGAAIADHVNAGFREDANWPDTALDHAFITSSGHSTGDDGVHQLELVITVLQARLLRWAAAAGHSPRINLPTPEIVILPESQAGKWPERLSPDESLVYSTIVELLAAHDIQTFDYAMLMEAVKGELMGATGSANMDETALLGGDIWLTFSHRVEPRDGDRIDACVQIRATLVTTNQTIFAATEWSGEMPANQRSKAIATAATAAAASCVGHALDGYHVVYQSGVPYRVTVSNVPEDFEMEFSDILQSACAEGKRLTNYRYRDGVVETVVHAKADPYADPREFRRFLSTKLREKGYTLRNQTARAHFLFGELSPR